MKKKQIIGLVVAAGTVRWSQCCQRIYQYNFKKSASEQCR